ncbi:glutaminyl-peptide cyclotransferase [Lentzea sp. NPDC005914]|uniref:glutaminyl-peptide cyclotransferase n=1 Tax=Lentzea sp. NPDC005914 TaxID=3154572 RepID=UPI0033E1FBC5
MRVNGLLALALAVTSCAAPPPSPPPPPPHQRLDFAVSTSATAARSPSRHFRAQVLESVRTDRSDARGLELVGDVLMENTGQAIRAVTPSTGDVRARRDVPPGIGIALSPAGLWQAGAGSVTLRDPGTLAPRLQTALPEVSWGLCDDGTHLVQSNGTTTLLLRDRDTAALIRSVRLDTRVWSTARLGELHCTTVNGRPEVWASVTGTDWLVRADLTAATVTAVADLTAVTVAEQPTGADQVIGGIAAAGATDQLWITGRHYHHRYRIRLQPQP